MTNQEKVTLNKTQYNIIEKLFCNTQKELITSLTAFFEETYTKSRVVATSQYIVAIGDAPIALVAHADTVHRTPVQELYYDKGYNMMWSPQGLGADDRAGIFAMLEILQKGYKPTIVITTDEEIGALGAQKLVKDVPECPVDINLIVELDRKGREDCVFYDCDNPEFETYIESFGFKTAFGSFSDICYICPDWGVAGVNLSIGYYDEHTKQERLCVTHMMEVIDKVCNIVEDSSNQEKFIFIESIGNSYSAYGYGKYGYDSSFWNDLDKSTSGEHFNDDAYGYGSPSEEDIYSEEMSVCTDCVGIFKSKHIMISEDSLEYCESCYNKRFRICPCCDKDYDIISQEDYICSDCREGGAFIDENKND